MMKLPKLASIALWHRSSTIANFVQNTTSHEVHMTRNAEDCTSRSAALVNLTVVNTQIVLGNPLSRENSSIVFQLRNPATGVEGECAAHGPALTPNGVGSDPYIWYNCFVESRNPSITKMFQYDSVINQLSVNETWICDDNTADNM